MEFDYVQYESWTQLKGGGNVHFTIKSEFTGIKLNKEYSHSSGTATPFPRKTWELLIEQSYNESWSGS